MHRLSKNSLGTAAPHLTVHDRRAVLTLIALFWSVASGATVHRAQAGTGIWTSHGPAGVSVSSLVIDPMTPSTLYAGTYRNPTTGGGVFKSTDSGGSWRLAGLTDVSALAIDPITPTTLYAGTSSGDLFKSTDSGRTWNPTSLTTSDGHPDAVLSALAIDPTAPATVYAGVYDVGVFKSRDGGSTWSATGLTFPAGGDPDAVFGYSVQALAIDPTMPTVVYVGTGYVGALKSTDGGSTWRRMNIGVPNVQTLIIAPATPTTLYAGTQSGGVVKSTDGGGSWRSINMGLATTLYAGTSVGALAIDPTTPATLYAGTALAGVFKSTDSGGTWKSIGLDTTSGDTHNTVVNALAIDPTMPSRVYAGMALGGVFHIDQSPACVGDCDSNGTVSVDEIVRMVFIALNGETTPSSCPGIVQWCNSGPAADAVAITCVVAAVNNALTGCATPAPTATTPCTPGAHPAPGCADEAPTFTPTPPPTLTPAASPICPTVPVPTPRCFDGEYRSCGYNRAGCEVCGCCFKFVGGCCDFGGLRPCFPLRVGQDAGGCMNRGGFPTGCPAPVICNESTGQCELQ